MMLRLCGKSPSLSVFRALIVIGAIPLLTTCSVQAQMQPPIVLNGVPHPAQLPPIGPGEAPGYYAATGYYGTTYGYNSYGVPRTYSNYPSPWGPNYALGYGSAFVPPGFGGGLYRPGFSMPGYTYGRGYYGTYPAPANAYVLPVGPIPPGYRSPPIGVYAPGLGPSIPGIDRN